MNQLCSALPEIKSGPNRQFGSFAARSVFAKRRRYQWLLISYSPPIAWPGNYRLSPAKNKCTGNQSFRDTVNIFSCISSCPFVLFLKWLTKMVSKHTVTILKMVQELNVPFFWFYPQSRSVLRMKGKGGFKAWATNGLVRLVIRCTEQKIAGMVSLLLYVH